MKVANVKAVKCLHHEQINSAPALPGVEIGVCSKCGQTIQYDHSGMKTKVTLSKLGRLDGNIVIPKSSLGDFLLLGVEDREDLKAVLAAPAPEPEAEPAPATTPHKPKRGKGYLRKVQEYYAQNKEAIIEDYYSMSRLALFSKWDLNSTVWMKLQKRWEVAPKGPVHRFTGAPIKTSKPPSESTDKGAQKVSGNGALPPFPAFNEGWPPQVKVEWFRTYKEVALKGDR